MSNGGSPHRHDDRKTVERKPTAAAARKSPGSASKPQSTAVPRTK